MVQWYKTYVSMASRIVTPSPNLFIDRFLTGTRVMGKSIDLQALKAEDCETVRQ